jgi:hypothetical protein
MKHGQHHDSKRLVQAKDGVRKTTNLNATNGSVFYWEPLRICGREFDCLLDL